MAEIASIARRTRWSVCTCTVLVLVGSGWIAPARSQTFTPPSPPATADAAASGTTAASNVASGNTAAGNVAAETPAVAPQLQHGQVELQHSHVYIRVGKARIGHEHAVIGKLKSGHLHLWAADDPKQDPGKLVFDMTSFDADGDAARRYIGMNDSIDDATRKQVNENMLGKEVLDVRNHPTATFVALKVTRAAEASPRGLPQYDIAGDFTLHGTTRPIHFIVDVDEIKGWLRIRGAFAILQTQYGIKPYTKMFGAIGVADKLDIYGDLIVAP